MSFYLGGKGSRKGSPKGVPWGAPRPDKSKNKSKGKGPSAPSYAAPEPPLPPDPLIGWEQTRQQGEQARERLHNVRAEATTLDLNNPYQSVMDMAGRHDRAAAEASDLMRRAADGAIAGANYDLTVAGRYIRPPKDFNLKDAGKKALEVANMFTS